MGVSGLLGLLKSIQRPCNLQKFSGQTIGVDAYGWLHRGTVSCAIDLALDKPTTKYVDFAMSRVRMLVHFGITPYIIFDGDYLPSKAGTEKDRAGRRKESKRTGLELLKLGKTSQAHQELQKAVDVTPEMARMFIEELKHHNIQYVVAPYEADAQLAYLERKGIIDGILSEDSDLLVFGAKRLITKLDQYGDCILINRNEFTACREVSLVGWTDADFRRMAILSGCDYLASISNMGLKTAYRLLRKHKTVDRLLRAIQLDGKFKVPPGYLDAFNQAERTFLYQWAFCPLTDQLVNCMDPEEGIEPETMPYIGSFVEAELARGVARGDLHPHTKEPIVVQPRDRTHSRPLRPASKQQASAQTPDLKKTKGIDTFFKPKRMPLAELDPNSFTPSPSQQRLLSQENRSWSANPAPSQTQANRRHSSVMPPPSHPPRRAISDSFAGSASAPHPSKRQRLCTDPVLETPISDSTKVESGRSRFFPASTDPSPSVRPSKKQPRRSSSEFELYSDDSIEEAMAALPDFDNSPPKPKRKMGIFADETPQTDSQSTICSTGSTVFSQESISTLTPATSFSGSPAPEDETVFSASINSQLKDLRSKFSFQARAKVREASPLPSPLARIGSRALSKKSLARTSSAPVSNPILSAISNGAVSTEDGLDAPRKGSESEDPSIESTGETSSEEASSVTQTAACTTEDVQVSEIEDSAWATMDAQVINTTKDYLPRVPESDSGHITDSFQVKGSEDLIIPDSEEEESDGSVSGKPRLNLKRFVFSGN